MPEPTSSDRHIGHPSLDEIIEAFEVVWNRDGDAQVENFLPATDHPQYKTIAVELLCVDLERRAQSGRRKTIEAYRQQFPGPLSSPHALERLAFEEYRWRRQHDEQTSPSEYARQYRIPTDHWPAALTSDTRSDRLSCSPAFPEIGDRFLDFDIIQQLGESKLGRVYLATQSDLASRFVVIKVATDLWSESERLARLQHTNVVPIYSVHHRNGLQAVCMPYLGRQTLADVLRKFEGRAEITGSDFRELLFSGYDADTSIVETSRPVLRQLNDFTFEQLCAWITAQIADGLAHAHDRGILHRDLKPANILLTNYCQPMILDFNLSEDIVAGGRDSLLVGGTMPYMAPEHLKAVFSIGHIDMRSDIYSLGVILFQMLTGRLPFPPQAGSILATLSLVINERASTTPSVREINPKISQALDAITGRCLAPDPNQRYQSARELQEDLELHIQDYPLRHTANPSIRERIQKWLRRHPRFSSTGAMTAVLVVVLAVATSLIMVRGRHVARLEATHDFGEFEQLARAAKVPLSVPMSHAETLAVGWQSAETALWLFDIDSPDWQRNNKPYRLLGDLQQAHLRKSVQELLFLMAGKSYQRVGQSDSEPERLAQLELALSYNEMAQQCDAKPLRALLVQEADIHRLLGRDDEAARLVDEANKLPLVDKLDRYAMAVYYIGDKQFTPAARLLADLSVDSPDNFFVWFLLAHYYYMTGEYADADSFFTHCVALWPDNYLTYFHRGLNRLKSGQYARAKTDFNTSLKYFPHQTQTLLNRALISMKLGEFQAAVDDLTLAIELGRHEPHVYFTRAKAWEKLGDQQQALRDRQFGLRAEPVSTDGWLQRATLRRSDDPLGALADLDEALQLAPKSVRALRNKAYVLGDLLQRPADAIEALDRILALNPDDTLALMGRAVLNARLNKRDAAVNDAREALRLDPSAELFYQAACVFAQVSKGSGDDESEAVQLLGEAIKRDIRWAAAATKSRELQPITKRPEYRQLIAAAFTLSKAQTTLLDDSEDSDVKARKDP